MRSFKSNENIHKKEGGSYYVVSANKVYENVGSDSADGAGIPAEDPEIEYLFCGAPSGSEK